MASTLIDTDYVERTELRMQAHYWRAQHARISKREALLKAKIKELDETLLRRDAKIKELDETLRHRDATVKQLEQQIEALKAKLVWLKKQVFGRKTEQMESEPSDKRSHISHFCKDPSQKKRNRGQQRGTKGHGRKLRTNLPYEIEPHTLPEGKCQCPKCGKLFLIIPGTEDSEEIEWDVVLRRRIHKRTRYISTCDCEAVPGIITAPIPGKLIPKGMFATSFWMRLIMEKFLFQRPLYRICKVLAMEGLDVSQGTLTGGLQRLGELLQPVYTRILERNRAAKHWKWDETHWMVFAEIEDKEGNRWWLWVAITEDTVVYILDPTRSARVPKEHLGKNPKGIINADRYSVYKTLGKHILVAFSWNHVRRDFIRIHDGYKRLHDWAESWVERINGIFHQNNIRLSVLLKPRLFQKEDKILRKAISSMARRFKLELANPNLHEAARKALESLRNHWKGCILFVDRPEIPMGNNESERMLRNPVVGRKNYYGSGSVWSGILTSHLFTIFQTLLKNNIDPQKWLLAYFNACAQNNGHPPRNIDSFLPWNLSKEQKFAWCHKGQSP